MIVRMSKVEIVGPKELLQNVLFLVRDLGIFQIEPAVVGFIEMGQETQVRTFLPDEKTLMERLFLEDLRNKITELDSFLPKIAIRTSYLDPTTILDTISKTVTRHTAQAKDMSDKRDVLLKERSELGRFTVFLGALAGLMGCAKDTPDLDFIGLTIQQPDMVGHLREALSRITDWKFELTTESADDGTLVGLITVEKEVADKVKKSLSDEHVPELTFPSSFSGLSFSEKVNYVNTRIAGVSGEIRMIEEELTRFAMQWAPIYHAVRDWIEDRLALLSATASVFETRMCFFINGWMPSTETKGLIEKLSQAFGPKVILDEREMREDDLDRVPIILKNTAYFKPFELFTKLLPLPSYTSYDPTPFMGIFFPIFFGLILGDAGYGLILCITAFVLLRKFRNPCTVRDGARILLVSAAYSIFFGILFGEFLGDLPHRLFGWEPLCIERRTAIVPMLFFAMAIGAAHVMLGLLLGALTAFRKKTRGEAVFKLLSIIFILCLASALASYFGVFPGPLARPVILVILFLAPLLFFTGGMLAPLELLKSIGNIISYVRIMAIGLTSVLLAFVANRLAGLTGDVVTGVAVAALLHLLNLVLGVFSPAIHSLRLHYVEFFSKFMEHGGRRFEPLRK